MKPGLYEKLLNRADVQALAKLDPKLKAEHRVVE
jgi:hypothetical protein